MMDCFYLNQTELEKELNRCLGCKAKPCEKSCPVNCCPQEFIKQAKEKSFAEALETIYKNNPLGQTCGLICPHSFCMKSCLRSKIDSAIKIPSIQATLIHQHHEEFSVQKYGQPNGKKIAVVGAGPAGIAAVWFLTKTGYCVDVFEMSNKIGGALNLIPQSRLPHEVIESDWKFVQSLGNINIFLNHKIQNPLNLLSSYAGVIMAIGEQIPVELNIVGEKYMCSYTDYLKNPSTYNNEIVAIIGGGKVAFDCVNTALGYGAKDVHLLVRRTMADIKMDSQEIDYMIEHNVKLHTNTVANSLKNDYNLLSLEVAETIVENGKCVNSGKTSLMEQKFTTVIKAIGCKAEKPIEHEKIIYAGDCKIGGSTVVEAIASGIDAAKILNQKL